MSYYSRIAYTGDGSTSVWTIPFKYIDKSHVKVYLNGVETSFTWESNTQIKLSSAPAVDVVILIKRITPRTQRIVDFETASLTDSQTYNLEGDQQFFISQEIIDSTDTYLGQDVNFQWDAQGKLIKSCNHPVDPTDVATKHYVDKGSWDLVKAEVDKAASYVYICEEKAQLATDKTAEVVTAASSVESQIEMATIEATTNAITAVTTNVENAVSEAETFATNAENSANNAAASAIEAANSAASFAAVPVGSIHYFPRTTPPPGYLECNGAVVSRATYAALWTEAQSSGNLVSEAAWAAGSIGSYSVGNGSTTFRLPELRAEYIRGWDNSRGIDTGRALGSYQADAFQGHYHALRNWGAGSSSYVPTLSGAFSAGDYTPGTVTNPITDGSHGTPRIASETRPRNVALLVCIKV